jgi:hypothetical protein
MPKRPLGLKADDRGTLAKWAREGEPVDVRRALLCDLPQEHTHVLLVVDQFEELWTSAAEDERERFVDLLLELTRSDDTRVRVLLTMRQDYANLCSAIPALHEHLERNDRLARYPLGRISKDGLHRVVTEPLRLASSGIPAGRLAA